jgi:hypothetical protein
MAFIVWLTAKYLYSPAGPVNVVPNFSGALKTGDPSEAHVIFSAIV